MRLSSKHPNQQVFALSDFTGGLNTDTTKEQIADNQLAESVNFEVQSTTGLLKTVNGTRKLYRLPESSEYKFVAAAYDRLNGHIVLFGDNGGIFSTKNMQEVRQIGNLTGELLPITAIWEDGLLVASGGHLQYIDGFQIKTITSSPEKCKGCYVRSGRVIVFDDENVRYSGVGDEENWTEDSDDPSAAVWVEAGYKAGGKIIGMVNLSSDILIIKDNGMLFRLSGEYPDWSISEIAREVDCRGANSYCNVVNTTCILGEKTMRAIVTTQEYGSMRANSLGDNVRSEIRQLPKDAKMRYVPPLNQIWIIGSAGSVLMFDLNCNAFFKRLFNANVVDVVSVNEDVYVIKENGIDILDEASFSDETDYLSYSLQMKTRISHYDFLVKRIAFACTGYAVSGSDTAFYIGNVVKIPLPSKLAYNEADYVYENWGLVYGNKEYVNRGKNANHRIVYVNRDVYVYDNWEFVYGNGDYILDFDGYVIRDERIRYRDKALVMKLQGKGSKFILNGIKLDVAEV